MPLFRRKGRDRDDAARAEALDRYLATNSSPVPRAPEPDSGKELRCPYCSQLTPAAGWPDWGDRVAFYVQTRARTEEEPGAHRIEFGCRHCHEAFFVVWDQDPRPARERSAQSAPSPVLPNDRLRALRSAIDQLAAQHPPADEVLAPRILKQLPWISQQLEEAASALETGADHQGNPITETQVVAGLRQLTGIVCETGYLSTMETAYPGIAGPLRQCMDPLDVVVADIESGPGGAAPSSKGIDTLVELSGPGILFPSTYVDRAVEELRVEGEPGSRALAVLIRELLACRSPVILDALEVAQQVVPVPELLDALHTVANAPEMAEAPANARFTPESVGNGRVGWTSGTQVTAVGRAMEALTPRDQGD